MNKNPYMIVRWIAWWKEQVRDVRGRVSVAVILSGIFMAAAAIIVNFWATGALYHARFTFAQSTATTTVTVLNTPPNWTTNAYENPVSTTTAPTNVGSKVTWYAVATDPNNDSYYLLLCKSTSTPTPGTAGGPPTCGGGTVNQWGVSAVTPSTGTATTTYTASSSDPQFDSWYAWICDNNFGGAKCNATYTTGSPFVVNHPPAFTSLSNTGPVNPGTNISWTAVASDSDTFTGATDTIQLFVCKANDFTGSACGPAGTYCTSATTTLNPTCSYTTPLPRPDGTYSSYGYVVDQHGLPASGGAEGATSTYAINNVAPTIASSSISLLNNDGTTNPLALTVPGGQTNGFAVKFTVSDDNSCQTISGGQEITSAIINVYRSGIGQASCQTGPNYNPDNCYPNAVGSSTWPVTCTQDTGSCNGSSSISATWTCYFPLWYVADPTDGTTASDTQYYNQNWLVSAQATNHNGSSSPLTEAATGNEVASFLAAQLDTPAINFGGLSPGSSTPTLATSTILASTGNVGLNETLYGANMCTTYPSCAVSTTSTIPVGQIQYATSSVAYGSGAALLTNPGTLVPIHIPKSIATSSPSTGSTFWGIAVPSTIQLSGAYTGQNTFVGVKSPAQYW